MDVEPSSVPINAPSYPVPAALPADTSNDIPNRKTLSHSPSNSSDVSLNPNAECHTSAPRSSKKESHASTVNSLSPSPTRPSFSLNNRNSCFSDCVLKVDEFRPPPPLHCESVADLVPLSRVQSSAGSFSPRNTPIVPSHVRSSHFLLAHARGPTAKQEEQGARQYESSNHYLASRGFLGGLIKPPVVRQFLHNGHLYKEEEDRGISHFELFADLIFVAIVHIFGTAAAEEPSIVNAVKFILIFWPPWTIWADMRSYINVSGTDDIIQRGYILLSSLLLVGYAAQGASIHVEASELQTSLPSRDIHHVAISGEGYEALRAATGFLLTAKGLRLLLLGTYAWALPRFRIAHLVQAFFTLLPCLVFLRLFFVSEVVDVVGTLACGIMLEVLGKYIAGLVVHLGVTEKNKHRHFVPALEIGHVIEKTAAFFVLVSGEILIAVAYVVHKQDEIGPHGEYLRSCLGITLVFLLCWTYFDADSCKVFVHAIRRHWFSSISWTQLHLPLCAGLVLVAASIHHMIIHHIVEQVLRWYFAIGMSIVLICLGVIGFLHRSLDKPGSSWLPRWFRLGLRLMLGCAYPFFPLYHNDSSVLELGFYTAFMALLVFIETIGKLGTVGNTIEASREQSSRDSGKSLEDSHAYERSRHSQPEAAMEYFSREKRYRREELTAYEQGEEDVGGQNSVGLMKAFSIRRGQRTGLAAF